MLRFKWKENKIRVITWGILFMIMCIYFISLYYTDIFITYAHSLTFLDCVKEGSIIDFYGITEQNQVNGAPALYFIPIYIIFAVWNLPVWVISRFWGVSIDNVGCMLWSKGIVVLFTAGSIWLLYLLLKKLGYEHLEYVCFLFASSLLFFVPVLAVAQYDVINIFFILCGIYLYAEDEKLSWRSLLLFSIAVSMKFFALFPFIILVLIIEKRIFYIVYDIFGGLLFSTVMMVPWYIDYKNIGMSFNAGWIRTLVGTSVEGGISEISIFLLGFSAIVVVAYVSRTETVQSCLKLMIWLSFAFFLFFFSILWAHPYWIVMLLPFLLPLVIDERKNLKFNIILEMILECSIIFVQGFAFSWVYFYEKSFSFLVFKNTGYKLGEGFASLADLLVGLKLNKSIPCLYAAFIATGITLLVINNPWKPICLRNTEKEIRYAETISRFIRIGMVMIYLLITYIIAYLI